MLVLSTYMHLYQRTSLRSCKRISLSEPRFGLASESRFMAGLENKQARNILLGASTQSGLFLPSHALRGCGVLVADLEARELRQLPFWLSSAEAEAEAIYLEAERQRRQSPLKRSMLGSWAASAPP